MCVYIYILNMTWHFCKTESVKKGVVLKTNYSAMSMDVSLLKIKFFTAHCFPYRIQSGMSISKE